MVLPPDGWSCGWVDTQPVSAAAIGGVGEWAEQQRDVIVPLPGGHGEVHVDMRIERIRLSGGKVVGDREGDPVGSRRQLVRSEISHPAVSVGDRGAQLGSGRVGQQDLDPCGRAAGGRVQDVGGDEAHDVTAAANRSRAI